MLKLNVTYKYYFFNSNIKTILKLSLLTAVTVICSMVSHERGYEPIHLNRSMSTVYLIIVYTCIVIIFD